MATSHIRHQPAEPAVMRRLTCFRRGRGEKGTHAPEYPPSARPVQQTGRAEPKETCDMKSNPVHGPAQRPARARMKPHGDPGNYRLESDRAPNGARRLIDAEYPRARPDQPGSPYGISKYQRTKYIRA